jgi:hypothetical protein
MFMCVQVMNSGKHAHGGKPARAEKHERALKNSSVNPQTLLKRRNSTGFRNYKSALQRLIDNFILEE